jgi:L-methionine (R)-S-oxide reductase
MPITGSTTMVEPLLARLDALAAGGAPFEDVLEAAVAGVHEMDPRFHWTGIYELFEDGMLRLGPFIGAPTEHVFIGYGQGICGTAVAQRRNLNIPDVSKVENYLACSTQTRSELVVLIRSGELIHGQIDIDSHELAAFDESAVLEIQVVADWLARYYAARPGA